MDTTHIQADLRKIIDISGQIFLDLSSNFPILISELDKTRSIKNGEHSKSYTFDSVLNNLSILISKEAEALQEDKAFFNSFQKKNNDLFVNLSEKMDFLTQMTDLILKIKDESMEMEIISLNAMIVSIKSGKEGHSFSYITDNLKRLSLKLISQSDMLISYESSIQKNIVALKATIDELSTKDVGVSFFSGNTFSDILGNVSLITNTLTKINTLSKEVKTPIIRAMEAIQLQDIIRQSLNDVELTVSKIEEIHEADDYATKLDQLVFNIQLAELAGTLITEIETRITECIELFQENRKLTNTILSQVETERVGFMENFLEQKDQNVATKNFQSLISSVIAEFEAFIKSVYIYQMAQGKVLEKSLSIQEEVVHTQSCFADFFPIINNLQYVAIAQRIEVARNTAIESIRSTVERMSELITQTNGNVENAQMQLQNFMDVTGGLIQKFSAETAQNKIRFDMIKTSKASFLENLQFYQQEFITLLSNFIIYSPNFVAAYDAIDASIDSLQNLYKILRATQEALKVVEDDSRSKQAKLLKENDLDHWEMRNDSFNNFINHFTIVSDKQTAGLLGGFEVEKGTSAGDITFF